MVDDDKKAIIVIGLSIIIACLFVFLSECPNYDIGSWESVLDEDDNIGALDAENIIINSEPSLINNSDRTWYVSSEDADGLYHLYFWNDDGWIELDT
ncbi:MAG: hypothetical protein KAJ39_07820 [Gammaproteobacteria bacterium]|nr:hypothetical protein [Gammaproteobacteria bacterium]